MNRIKKLKSILLISLVGLSSFLIFLIPVLPTKDQYFTEEDIYSFLQGDDPLLLQCKAEAAQGDYSAARVLLRDYWRQRTYEPVSTHLPDNRSVWKVDRLIENRTWGAVGLTYDLPKNGDGTKVLSFPGRPDRTIVDCRWYDNPSFDPEWIFQIARFHFLDSVSKQYLSEVEMGNITRAEYYAEALIDMHIDFHEQNPPGTINVWRTLDTSARVKNTMEAMDAIRNSTAFTPEVCMYMLRTLLTEGKYILNFHKTVSNWGVSEIVSILYMAIYLPDISLVVDDWQILAWNNLDDLYFSSFHPDGGLKEHTSGYHSGTVQTLGTTLELLDIYSWWNYEPAFRPELVKGYQLTAQLKYPNWATIPLGDAGYGTGAKSTLILAQGARLYPDSWLGYFNGTDGRPINIDKEPPRNMMFPDSGMYISRSKWNDTDALYSTLDGSNAGTGHSHPDLLNVNIYGYGRRFLVDSQKYRYADCQGAQFTSSIYNHNVPIIDDKSYNHLECEVYSASWMGGDLGTVARASHKEFGSELAREWSFVNFRDNLVYAGENNLNASENSDSGRYWVASDFWMGRGKHTIDVNWLSPSFNPLWMDSQSNKIHGPSDGKLVANNVSYSTGYSRGNLGVYSFGPWETDGVQLQHGAMTKEQAESAPLKDFSPENRPYGFYSNGWGNVNNGTSMRFLAEVRDPWNWFTVMYPSESRPEIAVDTPEFEWDGENFISNGMMQTPGNVFTVEYENSIDLHISMREKEDYLPVTVVLNNSTYEFTGAHVILHVDKTTNNVTQITAEDIVNLSVNSTSYVEREGSNLNITRQLEDLEYLTLSKSAASPTSFNPANLYSITQIICGDEIYNAADFTDEANNAINLRYNYLNGGL